MEKRKQAIVIGGSIVGLATAKTLAESFTHVVVLEQDDPPQADHPRRYVPQSGLPHFLIRGGVMVAEQLFPGFCEDMKQNQITPIDETCDVSVSLHGVSLLTFPSGSYVYPQTRTHLEHYLYQRVQQIPQVEIRHNVRVRDLVWDEGGKQVLGVQLITGEQVRGELVVDASGRSSRLPYWLEQAGYPKPHTDTVHIDLLYAARIFRNKSDIAPSIRTRLVQDLPEKKGRTGIVVPIENNRWFVLLCGYHGDHPPKEPEGFLTFAKSLPSVEIARIIESLEPEGDILTYSFKESIWRRYDLLDSNPTGILALGDAVCSVDPKFAAGMTKGLQEVAVLQNLLRTSVSVEKLAHRFYQKARPFVESAWNIGASEDFLLTGTTGDKPNHLSILQRYNEWLVRSASYDPVVTKAFFQVLMLSRRATSLLAPLLLLRVLFNHFIREKWSRHASTIPRQKA